MRTRSVLTLALACYLAPAGAATISVTTIADMVAVDGQCALREAIDNANLTGGGDATGGDCASGSSGIDTILVPAGVFAIELAGSGDDLNANGDLDVLADLTIIGVGAGVSVLDGAGIDRVLDVAPDLSPASFTLVGITVRGGDPGAFPGGGMRISNGSGAIITAAAFVDNHAANGGAVYSGGILDVADSTFSANSSVGSGGAVYVSASAEFRDVSMISNSATPADGGALYSDAAPLSVIGGSFERNGATDEGGAIFASGSSTIVGADFVDNGFPAGSGAPVAAGGALFLVGGGDFSVTDSLFERNVSLFVGGSIDASLADDLTVDGCVFRDSEAMKNGSAIRARNLILSASAVDGSYAALGNAAVDVLFVAEIDHSSITRSDGLGSPVAVQCETLILRNSTISENLKDPFSVRNLVLEFVTIANNQGTGLSVGTATDVQVKNTIIAGNVTDCIVYDASGFHSLGYNLDSDGSCFGSGPGDLSGVSPNLGPLANNGGSTETHALISPSPAIDSADPACEDGLGSTVTDDQRLVERPMDGDSNGNARCDRGSFEAPNPNPAIPPPVPDGILGAPLGADRGTPSGSEIQIEWDTVSCPGVGYHLLYGPLADVSAHLPGGAECGLSATGSWTWSSVPGGDLYFLLVADDGSATEGTWGQATPGERGGAAPSLECGISVRDNSGTCP